MGFQDIGTSIRMRDAIASIAEGVVKKMRPEERIGKVYSIDFWTQTAKIYFPGETISSLVEAHFSKDMIPTIIMQPSFASLGYDAPGDVVRIAGKPGSYYIIDFVSGQPSQLFTGPDSGSLKRIFNIASFEEANPNLTGNIVIQTNLGNTNQMIRLHVSGWTYMAQDNIIDLTLTFYPFADDGNIYNADLVNNGSMRFSSIQILKRTSDGMIAIALQPDTTSNLWHYPKLVVDAMFGHIDADPSKFLGWSISRIASLSSYTNKKTYDDGPMHMRAILNAAEPTPTGAWYNAINWTITDSDPDIAYSGTSTWTFNKAGTYLFTASAMFRNDISSAGVRSIGLNIIGSGHIMEDYSPPIVGQGDYATSRVSGVCRLNAGAQLQFQTLQNSGGTVNLHQGMYTQLTVTRLGTR